MKQANLINYDSKARILVITSCSKKKLKHPAIAKELYQGTLFKKVKILAQKLDADLMILSAKYGLIDSNKEIRPYYQIIKNSEDINNLRKTEQPKLEKIYDQYKRVVIIMGSNYRKILQPLISDITKNFLWIYSRKGIGGYLEKLNIMNKCSNQELRRFILA